MTPRISLALAGGLIIALAAVCFSADVQERVSPPEDAAMLHLSVVGVSGSADYQRIMTWFQRDERLSSMRASMHFHDVAAGSAIYNDRYRANIHGLPTIRLQDGNGTVLYETYGKDVPKSPIQLASALENETSQLLNRPISPWRRKMEQKCGPNGCPQPDAVPDEDLVPFEGDFVFDEPTEPIVPEDEGIPTWICVVLAAVSAAGGFIGAVIGSVRREVGA
jgi:hypothetical protein